MKDEIEQLEHISRHPIYSIADWTGRINIRNVWYEYNKETDRLQRSTKWDHAQEDLLHVDS